MVPTRLRGSLAFVGAVLLMCGAHAPAAIVQYSSRTLFGSAAGSTTTESLNSFAPQVNAFENVWFDFGDFSGRNGTNTSFGGDITNLGTIDGTIEIWGFLKIGGATLEFVFDSPITAIGFDANNLADQRYVDIIFDNADGDVVAVHDPVDQIRFWGFVSDTPFTSITFRQTGFDPGIGTDMDGILFDNFEYSAAIVPLPGGAAMACAAGVACLGLVRRRLVR